MCVCGGGGGGSGVGNTHDWLKTVIIKSAATYRKSQPWMDFFVVLLLECLTPICLQRRSSEH